MLWLPKVLSIAVWNVMRKAALSTPLMSVKVTRIQLRQKVKAT